VLYVNELIKVQDEKEQVETGKFTHEMVTVRFSSEAKAKARTGKSISMVAQRAALVCEDLACISRKE